MTDDTTHRSSVEVIDVEPHPDDDDAASDLTVADLTPALRATTALVTPAAPQEDIERAFTAYTALVEKLVDKREDYQVIQGKQFMKKAGLRKLAVAFGVSFKIDRWQHTYDADGRIVRSEFLVTATAPNGRFSDGYGACGVWDRCTKHYANCKDNCTKHCGGREGGCDGFNHYSKPEHDVPATAETRAKNRAASDLFAMGQVTAEEVDAQDPGTRQSTWEAHNEIMELGTRIKAAGYTGAALAHIDPATKALTVLGVPITEQDPADPASVFVCATVQQTDEVKRKLTAILDGLTKDAPASGDAPTTPDAGAGSAEEVPAVPPTAPTSPGAQPTGNEAGAPTGPGDSPQASAEVPPGDDAPTTVEPGAEGGPGEGDAPATPEPEPAPPELVGSGEATRIAMELKRVWSKDPESSLARAALVDIITNGRTRSARELFATEAPHAIKAAKLLTSGNIGFGVYEPADAEEPTLLDVGDVPQEGQVPTFLATMPEGGDFAPGEAFLIALGEFLGAGTEGGARL
jgi:hypothetical protein